MNPRIAEILGHLQTLENELEGELQKSRLGRGFSVRGTRVTFDPAARAEHRTWRVGLIAFLKRSTAASVLTAPVIYSMVVPLAVLDLWITVYQQIVFRAFRMTRVARSDYIVFDRHRLPYLNRLEALNCVYCGYANGVIAYAREIASRTEQYWCPIKHALRVQSPHQRYKQFLEYGDGEGYRSKLPEYRKLLEEPAAASGP